MRTIATCLWIAALTACQHQGESGPSSTAEPGAPTPVEETTPPSAPPIGTGTDTGEGIGPIARDMPGGSSGGAGGFSGIGGSGVGGASKQPIGSQPLGSLGKNLP